MNGSQPIHGLDLKDQLLVNQEIETVMTKDAVPIPDWDRALKLEGNMSRLQFASDRPWIDPFK